MRISMLSKIKIPVCILIGIICLVIIVWTASFVKGWKKKKSIIKGESYKADYVSYGSAIAITLLAVIVSFFLIMDSIIPNVKSRILYENKDNITTKLSERHETARINITDTYTKSGIKYYIFTTDVSRNRTFTCSEEEYDKYIGLGNNAVDCTIYTLYCASDIYKDYYFLEDIGHLEATENTKDYSFHSDILCSPYYIDSAYGKCFAYGDFCLDVENEEGWIIKNSTWTTEMRIQKYSFLGDTEFSEEELEKYKDLMDKVNKSILVRL